MKWLIRGVGMLTALFAVFFFLLVADKLYYQNSMATYEISLDRSLSGRQGLPVSKLCPDRQSDRERKLVLSDAKNV